MFTNAAFVIVNDPVGWYRHMQPGPRMNGVRFVVFQLEHCAETDVTCVRGFAQSQCKKTPDQWRTCLRLDARANLEESICSVTNMAKQCMTAGVDSNGRRWTVVEPHVMHGLLYISIVERMCIDLQNNWPCDFVKAKYPHGWRMHAKYMEAYKRVIDNCATASDWALGTHESVRLMFMDALIYHCKDDDEEEEGEVNIDPDTFLNL